MAELALLDSEGKPTEHRRSTERCPTFPTDAGPARCGLEGTPHTMHAYDYPRQR